MLALLTALAPLSIDMYLPGLPAVAVDLHGSAPAVQLTLTAFMIGLASGQLVIGPLSDRFGRRPLLLAGMAVCVLGGAACALAPTVGVLTTFRFLQGFGGAAGIVLSRAVISDRVHGAAAARVFSLLMMISSLAPVIAPLLGGLVINHTGWRGVFWILTALAATMFIGSIAWIPESHPAHRRTAGGLAALARDGASLLRNRRYLGYTLACALGFTVMFAYISASPFILQKGLGLSDIRYSVAFAANAAGLMATSILNGAIVGRVGQLRLLYVGTGLLLAFSSLIAVDVVLGPTLWPILILFWCNVSAVGLVFPNATALAMSEARHAAGTGSAILGALQFGIAALVSPLMGVAGEKSAGPMSVAMLAAAIGSAAALLLARQSHQQTPPDAAGGNTNPTDAKMADDTGQT